jgi:oligopeptide/dipeptide ABC transporter ATP-binding protein
MADRVGVVYAGKIVEMGPVEDIFHSPKHPYTEGLLNSMPGFSKRLKPIEGDAPELDDLPEGCAYSPRCPYVVERCRSERPEPLTVDRTEVRCFRANDLLLEGVG